MKHLNLFLCSALLVTATMVAGQTASISSWSDVINFMNSDLDYLENQRERYSKIEGSAYVDEAFQTGSVSYNRKKYMGLQLRHNPYEGYFEFKTDQGIKYIDPRVTPIDTVWLGEDTFIYIPYQSGKAVKRDYMKLISQGSTRVLRFSQVILIQPEPAKGYQEAKPARFEKRGDVIFIQTGDQTALEFSGKKSLEDIFPGHHAQLLEFARSEKLNLKKSGDIVRLCAYFDSIR
ncbi:MAG: hypothetical protein V2B15_16135 [Bacteroidota bacterium]